MSVSALLSRYATFISGRVRGSSGHHHIDGTVMGIYPVIPQHGSVGANGDLVTISPYSIGVMAKVMSSIKGRVPRSIKMTLRRAGNQAD